MSKHLAFQVLYWVNFLTARITPTEPIGHCGVSPRRSCLVLVATHVDSILPTPVVANDGTVNSSDTDAWLSTIMLRWGSEQLDFDVLANTVWGYDWLHETVFVVGSIFTRKDTLIIFGLNCKYDQKEITMFCCHSDFKRISTSTTRSSTSTPSSHHALEWKHCAPTWTMSEIQFYRYDLIYKVNLKFYSLPFHTEYFFLFVKINTIKWITG